MQCIFSVHFCSAFLQCVFAVLFCSALLKCVLVVYKLALASENLKEGMIHFQRPRKVILTANMTFIGLCMQTVEPTFRVESHKLFQSGMLRPLSQILG